MLVKYGISLLSKTPQALILSSLSPKSILMCKTSSWLLLVLEPNNEWHDKSMFSRYFFFKKVVSFAVISVDEEGVSLCQFDSLPFIRVCLVSVRDIDFIFVGVLGGNGFFLSFVSIIAVSIRCGVDVTRRVT